MKKLIAIAAVLLGTMLFPTATQAQLGGLLNKAKNKAKNIVGNKVPKQVQAATANYGQAAEATATQGTTANATKGDWDGLFIYDKKQFADQRVYLDGTEVTENYLIYMYSKFTDLLNAGIGHPRGVYNKGLVLLSNSDKALAYGEPVVNAFFYDYAVNPNTYKNFRYMIKAYIIAESYYTHKVHQTMVEGSWTDAVDGKGKTYVLYENEGNRIVRGAGLMRKAQEVALRADYNNIFDGTYSCYTQAEKAFKEGKNTAAYNNYREFFTAWDNFLTKHPQWQSDPRRPDFTQMYQAAKEREKEMRDAIIDDAKVPQDMPKTYKAIPGIEAKVRKCIGIEDPEHKGAPVYFLSEGWRPLMRSGSSNLIDQRAVDVGWTYTDAKGQKWLAYTTLMQKAVYHGLTVSYVDQFMFSGGFKTMKLK